MEAKSYLTDNPNIPLFPIKGKREIEESQNLISN
jgi:hypothetical protein